MSEAPAHAQASPSHAASDGHAFIAEGLPPPGNRMRPKTRALPMADALDRGDGANDARLLDNAPAPRSARKRGRPLGGFPDLSG